ncbi:MAG: DUF4268 domain-containing protein [Flavobacteriales bacterium]
MYSKEEHRQINIDFYTQLGELMKEDIPVSGDKVKWTNFRTGIKGLYFKLDADKRTCRLIIEIKNDDDSIRHLFYDQFEEFKVVLEETIQEEGIWFRDYYNDYGEVSSKIEWVIDEKVSKLKRETWGTMHNYLRDRLIGLDEFWGDVKDVFIELSK